jgi:hypothetical protein
MMTDYYPLYYSEIVNHLERHYSTIGQLCSDFNEFVRLKYHVNTRLDTFVLQWLHQRVGAGDTSNQVEIEMLAGGVKAIFEVCYGWFEKTICRSNEISLSVISLEKKSSDLVLYERTQQWQ